MLGILYVDGVRFLFEHKMSLARDPSKIFATTYSYFGESSERRCPLWFVAKKESHSKHFWSDEVPWDAAFNALAKYFRWIERRSDFFD